MKGKITLLVGGAIGYVLGSRAGRERYEQIKSQANSLWHDPKVQQKKQDAQRFAKEKTPVVKDAAAGAASSAASSATSASQSAKDKVGGGSDEQTSTYPTSATTGLN